MVLKMDNINYDISTEELFANIDKLTNEIDEIGKELDSYKNNNIY